MPVVITLCTGNAARSVMAGAILSDLVPGLEVMTRGTAVIEGLVTSWRTRAALEGLGLSADGHRSRQLTAADLDRADLVLAMATEHVRYVRRVHADAAGRTATLKRLARDLEPGDGELATRLDALHADATDLGVWEDIEDPVSGEVDQFHRCAAEIKSLLEQVVGVLGPALAPSDRRAATEAQPVVPAP
jgi:protein-tyrosine-phosphatase